MSVILNKRPASVCFTADGVSYLVIDTDPTSNSPKNFKFKLGVESDDGPDYEYITVDLVCYPEKGDQGENRFNIDLTDIIQTNTGRYHIYDYSDAEIFGYVTVQLTHIDGTSSNLDSTEHLCLPGTSGGVTLTGVMPSDKHPFLLARGEKKGSLHFYRSELEAMDEIYAFITDIYNDYHIETDNAQVDQRDYDGKMLSIDGYNNLFGIWLGSSLSSQFCIYSDANILLLYYHYNESFLINAIAIQDDPDTDEIHLIRWINSMGAPESLLFSGELKDISDVGQPNIYITEQSLCATARQHQHSLLTTKYSLHTGYLTSDRIQALRDMLCSDEVEILIDGEWIPVSVTADAKHAVHQREPEDFELTIEVLEQTRYPKLNRTVRALPDSRSDLLQDNSGNIIVDNNSNTIN